MNTGFRRALLILAIAALVAGCNPTVRVEIVTRVPAAQAESPEAPPGLTPLPEVAPDLLIAPSNQLPANGGAPVSVRPGPPLLSARAFHSATTLTDGRILLVGGNRTPYDSPTIVERYDPMSGQTQEVMPLHTGRGDHSATLLRDGRVLVVGGATNGSVAANDAEIYDPVADTWTVVPPLFEHGNRHVAGLLNDGRVLVVGGGPGPGVLTGRVEIFDPQTDTWSEARALDHERANATGQTLDDGRFLVIGGNAYGNITPPEGDAMLYDPATDTWTPTGPMIAPSIFSLSIKLRDGRVLVVGGMETTDIGTNKMTTRVEIYDPATNQWTLTGAMARARCYHTLVMRADGWVMVAGGMSDWAGNSDASYLVREIEVFNPAAKRWRTVGMLPSPRMESAMTLLANGAVWLTGGRRATETYFSDSWLIGAPRSSPAGRLKPLITTPTAD